MSLALPLAVVAIATCHADAPLAQSPSALVFQRGADLVGCVRDGRPRLLAQGECDLIFCVWAEPRVAGRLVAYGAQISWKCVTTSDVKVLDLRTGRVRRTVAAGSFGGVSESDGCSSSGGEVTDLVLRGTGGVAFIAADGPGRTEVVRADRFGFRVVARGAGIDRRSLTRSGSEIRWLDAGQPRTSRLR